MRSSTFYALAGVAPLASAFLVGGCSTTGSHCTVGQSAACACTNGEQGAQVCLTNGTFGTCVCDDDGGVAAAGSHVDAGLLTDGGPGDASLVDAGFDAGADAGTDAGLIGDAGVVDAGTDAGTTTDAGFYSDAGPPDAGMTDAGPADAGGIDAGLDAGTCSCTDPATCTDSCGNTGVAAPSCLGLACGADAGVDTCGQPYTPTCASPSTCTDSCGNTGTAATSCYAIAPCTDPATCMDSCGRTGFYAGNCAYMECSPLDNRMDTCGNNDPSCPCSASSATCISTGGGVDCVDSCGNHGTAATSCAGLQCAVPSDGYDTCGNIDPNCPACGCDVNGDGFPLWCSGPVATTYSYDGTIYGYSNTCPNDTICNSGDLNDTGVSEGTCVAAQYADNGDGTVTDALTGLVWQQAALDGPCPSDQGNCTLASAQVYCASLSLGSYSAGWRLPTLPEMFSLVELQTSSPNLMINQSAFPDMPSSLFFWTSTCGNGGADGGVVDCASAAYAWVVLFGAEGDPLAYAYVATWDVDNSENSDLSVLCVQSAGVEPTDAGPADAGPADAGPVEDGGSGADAGLADAGMSDGGVPDAGSADAGTAFDGGSTDAGATCITPGDPCNAGDSCCLLTICSGGTCCGPRGATCENGPLSVPCCNGCFDQECQ
jgi:uncharacterized protein DUF1566